MKKNKKQMKLEITLNKKFFLTLGVAVIVIAAGYTNIKTKKSIKVLNEKVAALGGSNTSSNVSGLNENDLKEYIIGNPEVLVQSLESYQAKMMEKQQQEGQASVKKNYDKIYSDSSFTAGNPDAEIKIVEFFDYNCGYCKVASKVLTELLEKNPNVQIYFKDTPILGESSTEAAKAAIAAGFLGKYKEYNKALFENEGELNEDTFRAIATKVGLNANELIEMMSSTKVSDLMLENRAASSLINLQGTPTIYIEDEFYQGEYSVDALQKVIRAKLEK